MELENNHLNNFGVALVKYIMAYPMDIVYLAVFIGANVFIYDALPRLHYKLYGVISPMEKRACVEINKSLDKSEKSALRMYQNESEKRLKSMIKEHVTIGVERSSTNKF